MSSVDHEDRPVARRKRRRGGFPLRWLVLLGLAAAIWFAPTIVALSPLRQTAVDYAVPELRGKIAIESASLGWLSPLVLRNVVWRDADGRPLAEVSSVRTERTLVQLLGNSKELGLVSLEEPKLYVTLRDDGSNLEDALAPLLARPATNQPLPACMVTASGGSVQLNGAAQTWQIEDIAAEVKLGGEAESPLEAKVAGQVRGGPGAGKFEAAGTWHFAGSQPQAGEPGGALSVKSEQAPLAMLQPLLRRWVAGAVLEGEVNSDLQIDFNADRSQWKLVARRLAGRNLRFAAPLWLGDDVLATSQLEVAGEAQLAGGAVRLEQMELRSDVASLSADGAFHLHEGSALGLAPVLASVLQNDNYRIAGELDVARLAELLPQTLRLRPSTKLTSGVVSVSLASDVEANRRRYHGQIQSSRLAAVQDGREIVWDEPIAVNFAAQQTSDGPVIENLSVAASFLEVKAQGTLAKGQLTASGDLAGLIEELGKFSNVDELQLTGKLAADLGWRRQGESAFQADGQVQVTDFELRAPGLLPWKESQVTVDLASAGLVQGGALRQLDAAAARLAAGGDQLDVTLTRPVENPLTSDTWPLRCAAKGELANWLPRLQGWLPVSGIAAQGTLTLAADVVSSRDALRIEQAKVDVADLRLRGEEFAVQEPEVHVTGDGVWRYTERKFTAEAITVASSALAFRADRVLVAPTGSGVALGGEIGYRGDIGRLAQWFEAPSAAPRTQWQGATTGRMKFAHEGALTQAVWTSEFENLALRIPEARAAGPIAAAATSGRGSWQTVWQEPKLTVSGQGNFDHQKRTLRVMRCDVTSDMVRLAAQGTLEGAGTAPRIEAGGTAAYDLAKVAALLAPYVGSELKLSGTDQRQFEVRGPLPTLTRFASATPGQAATERWVWPDDLTARAGLGWATAEMYGLPVGQGSIDAALKAGIVTIAPLDLAVADGRLKAWPRVVLSNDPMLFQLAQGTSLEKVQITPGMCQSWLKYVAPLLADATRAEGKFSLHLDGASLPVLSPAQGEARGTLGIHTARVGPGPLAETYVVLAEQVRAIVERKPLDPSFRATDVQWLTLPEQNVPVHMTGGRIHHRGLTMAVNTTTVVSSGSVGADQTLALVLEVPIKDQWIASEKLLAGLRGQSIKIPISGTFAQPKVDRRALDQLAAQLLGNAATGLLQQELEKGLDKLLRPRN